MRSVYAMSVLDRVYIVSFNLKYRGDDVPGQDAVAAHDLCQDPPPPPLHGADGVVPPEQQSASLISMGFFAEKTTQQQRALSKHPSNQQTVYKQATEQASKQPTVYNQATNSVQAGSRQQASKKEADRDEIHLLVK